MRLHSSPGTTPTQIIRILIADRNRMGNQLLAESLGRDPRLISLLRPRPRKFCRLSRNSSPIWP